MIGRSITASELWKSFKWKKFQKILFRLQKRVYKAVQVGDKRKARSLQKLILKSQAAKLLAIRQVTQLNAGKKTAGIDGKASLSFEERLALAVELMQHHNNWKHKGLREIPIPKKDGTTRMLKVPTIADRAWQCLAKYALEPAHEATFHARSYGFRTGRSTHDAQKYLFANLNSKANGNVKGEKSPYDGDISYWSERKSKLYDGATSKAIKKQSRKCVACGLTFIGEEKVHLHHADGNHDNWDKKNLVAIHESCHDYVHMSNRGKVVAIHEPCQSEPSTSKSAS